MLATPLEMATVAATIADGGHRPSRRSNRRPGRAGASVTSESATRTMRHLMIGVVREGTGTAGAIPA